MKFLFGNALWHLLAQSDFITKIIMFGLLLVSILCWTVIFYKWVQLSEKSKQLDKLVAKIDTVHTHKDITNFLYENQSLYGRKLLSEYMNARKSLGNKKLEYYEQEDLDYQRYAMIDELVFQESSYLLILFIAAACGPLIGLFGTVWGLMHSFMSIAQKHTADIVTVAPGIAEALLTTLAGLMVAIPALIMYHYLTHRVRLIEHDLCQISDTLARVTKTLILDVKE